MRVTSTSSAVFSIREIYSLGDDVWIDEVAIQWWINVDLVRCEEMIPRRSGKIVMSLHSWKQIFSEMV